MLSKRHKHSARDFIRALHVAAAKDTSDQVTQEWIDERDGVIKAGLQVPTVEGFNTLHAAIIAVNDRIPQLHAAFWDEHLGSGPSCVYIERY